MIYLMIYILLTTLKTKQSWTKTTRLAVGGPTKGTKTLNNPVPSLRLIRIMPLSSGQPPLCVRPPAAVNRHVHCIHNRSCTWRLNNFFYSKTSPNIVVWNVRFCWKSAVLVFYLFFQSSTR